MGLPLPGLLLLLDGLHLLQSGLLLEVDLGVLVCVSPDVELHVLT